MVETACDDDIDLSSPEGERRPRSLDGLDRGLPNHWFPIMRAADLRNAPVRLKRFGEYLTVWRDSAGNPRVFQDRCPHRGASLSLGKIRGDKLSCGYHGWTFDRSGTCVEIPLGEALGSRLTKLIQNASLTTYPAEDRAGYIWTFYGEPARVTPLDVVPYELEDPRWSVFRQDYVWNTNWINILDNILDPLHALFVHVGVATQLNRAKLMDFEVTDDFEEGFQLARRGVLVTGEVGDESAVEFLLPALFRVDLADGTPRGLLRVVMYPTPIDEHSTYLCYMQARRVSGLARLWWHIVWWARLRRAQDTIKAQDSAMLESLGPIEESRSNEHLSYSDTGVIHLRRRLNQAYTKSQAAEPGEQPPTRSRRVRGQRPYASWELESEEPDAR